MRLQRQTHAVEGCQGWEKRQRGDFFLDLPYFLLSSTERLVA
jgi:hypothetical protein